MTWVIRIVKACDLRPGERVLWRGREVTIVESEHLGQPRDVNRWGRLIVKDELSTRGLWCRRNDRLELVEAAVVPTVRAIIEVDDDIGEQVAPEEDLATG